VNGTTTVTITGSSGTLSHTAPISLAIAAPDFTLSALPGTIGVPQGSSGAINVNIGSSGGFSGSVNLAASGLPNGVTASFGAIGSGGSSTLTLTAGTSATAGTTSVTVTGTSGTLRHSTKITVTVIAQTAAASLVDLSSAFNIYGIVTDGSTFTNGGLDGGSDGVDEALSSTLLGVQKTIGGTTFYFGSANTMNAVSGQTIALPSGQFSKLQFLGTGVNGSQPAQSFVVTYGDGTTSTFTQSLSDWYTPQSFSGESKAITMPYRDTGMGVKDNRTFYLYEYSFTLTAGEQVSSITLPNNRNVVIVAMTLMP
jgi:hypothetical protein